MHPCSLNLEGERNLHTGEGQEKLSRSVGAGELGAHCVLWGSTCAHILSAGHQPVAAGRQLNLWEVSLVLISPVTSSVCGTLRLMCSFQG